MRKAGGAAAAVAALVAILHSSDAERSSVNRMNHTCRTCGGPSTFCVHCRHFHCDDTTCTEMPVPCALAEES